MAEPFIVCEQLVKIYKVADLEHVALQGLHITIERGELVGIIGASGSGKSTLMSILGGLDRPSAGTVLVGGRNLLRMPDRALNRYRREEVGFVWQQSARNLVPYLNAVRNVMLPMTLAGAAGRQSRKYAEELLEMVGLGERKFHKLPELSGGEQQRVAIAVALANRPSLLLADEPTGEVDSATAKTIYGTFQTLTREMGVTTLIVSHDPGIANHVDRVVMIRDGMLASETRRQPREQVLSASGDGTMVDADPDAEATFEELIVVDSAGRLHIPKDYLEQLEFGNRAQIEITDDGIVIRPAAKDEETPVDHGDADGVDALDEPAPKKRGLGRLFGSFGRRRKNKAAPTVEANGSTATGQGQVVPGAADSADATAVADVVQGD